MNTDLITTKLSSQGMRRMHRPIVAICLSFILGILIREWLYCPLMLLLFLIFTSLVLAYIFRRSNWGVFFILSVMFFWGWAQTQHKHIYPADHIRYIPYEMKRKVIIEGLIISEVEKRSHRQGVDKTVFTVDVQRFKNGEKWQKQSGLILVQHVEGADLRYGDVVVLEGKLHMPVVMGQDAGRMSYRNYLERQGILYVLSMKKGANLHVLKRDAGNPIVALSFKCKFLLSRMFDDYLPTEEAGIMKAFILGDRLGIPKDVFLSFKRCGVAHIIAISGFNVGIVSFLILLFLRMWPIPRAMALILTMILLVLYAFITGGQAPVVRATIAAVIFLFGFIVEKKADGLNTLAAAALLILVGNPQNLYDVGFQLSFGSVWSILCFYQKLENKLYQLFDINEQMIVWRFIVQSVAMSIVAYGGVLGLTLYYFHMLTPIMLLANLVVVPLSSFIVVLGMGLLMTGVCCPVLAAAFAHCIAFLLNMMIMSVDLMAQLPGAYILFN